MTVDLGGATFDVSIVKKNENDNRLEVLGIAGDNCLGGRDFTNEMVKLFMRKQDEAIEKDDEYDENDR